VLVVGSQELVDCSGGVACMWLDVDVDGSGGSEGKGSRMKGKRKKQKSWLDELERKTHHDAVRKNCGAHSTLAQIQRCS
jgi:hypothetical protein